MLIVPVDGAEPGEVGELERRREDRREPGLPHAHVRCARRRRDVGAAQRDVERRGDHRGLARERLRKREHCLVALADAHHVERDRRAGARGVGEARGHVGAGGKGSGGSELSVLSDHVEHDGRLDAALQRDGARLGLPRLEHRDRATRAAGGLRERDRPRSRPLRRVGRRARRGGRLHHEEPVTGRGDPEVHARDRRCSSVGGRDADGAALGRRQDHVGRRRARVDEDVQSPKRGRDLQRLRAASSFPRARSRRAAGWRSRRTGRRDRPRWSRRMPRRTGSRSCCSRRSRAAGERRGRPRRRRRSGRRARA